MSTTTMRAKLRVASVTINGAEGPHRSESLRFSAVCRSAGYPADGSDENNTFARFTPTADLSMCITNPALHGQFQEGQEFYVDFSPVHVAARAIAEADQQLENEIQAKGLTAPRVTPADVAAAIKGETYTVLPNGRTTVCQLTLDNGFTVEGYSAAVSIENFNADIGNQVARTNAVAQIWPLLGFRLRDKLAAA